MISTYQTLPDKPPTGHLTISSAHKLQTSQQWRQANTLTNSVNGVQPLALNGSYQQVPNPPYSLVQFNMIQGNLNTT
jgi:hypothetical protein